MESILLNTVDELGPKKLNERSPHFKYIYCMSKTIRSMLCRTCAAENIFMSNRDIKLFAWSLGFAV